MQKSRLQCYQESFLGERSSPEVASPGLEEDINELQDFTPDTRQTNWRMQETLFKKNRLTDFGSNLPLKTNKSAISLELLANSEESKKQENLDLTQKEINDEMSRIELLLKSELIPDQKSQVSRFTGGSRNLSQENDFMEFERYQILEEENQRFLEKARHSNNSVYQGEPSMRGSFENQLKTGHKSVAFKLDQKHNHTEPLSISSSQKSLSKTAHSLEQFQSPQSFTAQEQQYRGNSSLVSSHYGSKMASSAMINQFMKNQKGTKSVKELNSKSYISSKDTQENTGKFGCSHECFEEAQNHEQSVRDFYRQACQTSQVHGSRRPFADRSSEFTTGNRIECGQDPRFLVVQRSDLYGESPGQLSGMFQTAAWGENQLDQREYSNKLSSRSSQRREFNQQHLKQLSESQKFEQQKVQESILRHLQQQETFQDFSSSGSSSMPSQPSNFPQDSIDQINSLSGVKDKLKQAKAIFALEAMKNKNHEEEISNLKMQLGNLFAIMSSQNFGSPKTFQQRNTMDVLSPAEQTYSLSNQCSSGQRENMRQQKRYLQRIEEQKEKGSEALEDMMKAYTRTNYSDSNENQNELSFYEIEAQTTQKQNPYSSVKAQNNQLLSASGRTSLDQILSTTQISQVSSVFETLKTALQAKDAEIGQKNQIISQLKKNNDSLKKRNDQYQQQLASLWEQQTKNDDLLLIYNQRFNTIEEELRKYKRLFLEQSYRLQQYVNKFENVSPDIEKVNVQLIKNKSHRQLSSSSLEQMLSTQEGPDNRGPSSQKPKENIFSSGQYREKVDLANTGSHHQKTQTAKFPSPSEFKTFQQPNEPDTFILSSDGKSKQEQLIKVCTENSINLNNVLSNLNLSLGIDQTQLDLLQSIQASNQKAKEREAQKQYEIKLSDESMIIHSDNDEPLQESLLKLN